MKSWQVSAIVLSLVIIALINSRRGSRGTGYEFELVATSLQGKKIDLANYRGRVVLVDFWATWCPPCRGEVPHLKSAYNKFRDQGFEIISISLDNNPEVVAQFVADNQIKWPQIVQGNQELAQKYNVRSIPTTFLIDPAGKVAATDVRGKQIVIEVEKILNRYVPTSG